MNKFEARIEFFMEMCRLIATQSKDPNVRVGCVIVDDLRRVIGSGYNGFPRGVRDLPERLADKVTKNKLTVHAEANAILLAGNAARGQRLYCTRFPCSDCAKLIAQAGIAEVYAPELAPDSTWSEDAVFSQLILREAEVRVFTIEEKP